MTNNNPLIEGELNSTANKNNKEKGDQAVIDTQKK